MSGQSRRPTKRSRQQEGENNKSTARAMDMVEDGVAHADTTTSRLVCEEDSMSIHAKNRPPSSNIDGERNAASSSVIDDDKSARFRRFTTSPFRFNKSKSTTGPRRSSGGASVATSRKAYSASSRRITSSTSVHTTTVSTSQRRRPPSLAPHIVCAIGENLARETCVASVDARSPISLQVSKQGNGQTYAETLSYLQMLNPHEVLLNQGRKNSPLARKIVQLYENQEAIPETAPGAPEEQTVVKFISRSCFDQTKGAEMLAKLARTDTFDPTLVNEYILLSSAHAVLHYTQQTLGVAVARKCLDVVVNSGGTNRMSIDRGTLLQLELLINAKTGRTRNSLVSSIDCTRTTVGGRLLRTTLMAPPCRSDTINARLDLVDSFLRDEEFFYSVMHHLKNLPAVDKMLIDVAIVPQNRFQNPRGESPTVTARLASKGISALVCIKTTLSALPALAGVLQDHLNDLEKGSDYDGSDDSSAFTARSSLLVGLGYGPPSIARPHQQYLLRAIMQALSQPQLAEIRDLVSDVFTESTTFSRNANAMRHQECFALKSRDNGFMDVLRKAFLANVDDIYKKADEYAEIHGMHVSVRYSTSRGYYLSVPASHAASLPTDFIQPIKSGNHILCTTEEVHSLNIRAQDNVQDLLLMTHEQIQEVLADARSKYDALAALSDAVALLDLCHSFADKVALSKLPWSRPILQGDEGDGEKTLVDGEILIRNGRYGIDVSDSCFTTAGGPQDFIPNDTYASANKFFTVISGINGSGKSTYLKQIAIIVLLAHCGSYVPAEQASIPLRNRLCARMGTADDPEHNISSFMLEMKETAFICSNATEKSLVLLDELGRATSNEDGVSLAWAVSEFLLKKRSMTFFVTHYPQLCQLSKVYPSVQNQHLSASVSTVEAGDILYTHKLTSGPCPATTDYGVEMASSCGWPAEVVHDARQIKTKLGEFAHDNISTNDSPEARIAAARSSYLKNLSKELSRLVQNETSVPSLRTNLERLRISVAQNQQHPIADVQEYLSLHEAPQSSD